MASASGVMVGPAVSVWPATSTVTERSGRKVRISFLIETPVWSCRCRLIASAANTEVFLS